MSDTNFDMDRYRHITVFGSSSPICFIFT
jgi:hypothetical protein